MNIVIGILFGLAFCVCAFGFGYFLCEYLDRK